MMAELLQSQPGLMNFVIFFLQALALLLVILLFVVYVILAERKVLGFMQSRYGPNQLGGRYGLLQTVADVLKLMFKEDTIPSSADRFLFVVAPVLAFAPSFMIMAVIPFTEHLYYADLNVGVLYYVGVSGITTIGLLLGGWASNNKFGLLGGMRAAAQMISYEIPLVMSILSIVLMAGSMNLGDIVDGQKVVWNIIIQPVAFLVFFIAAMAEINRIPFDLPESENELIAGYQIEYGGFRWAMFYLAEYLYMFGMAALTTTLFLGGWHSPFGVLEFIPGAVWFALKFCLVVFVLIWIRATFPRMRPDVLMEFAWKVLLPVALANVLVTAVVKEIVKFF